LQDRPRYVLLVVFIRAPPLGQDNKEVGGETIMTATAGGRAARIGRFSL
jgi:hypothetical protein